MGRGGVLEASTGKKAYSCRSDLVLRGDFDVRVELRIAKTHSPDYAVALLGGLCDDNGYMTWGIEADKVFLLGRRLEDLPRRYRFQTPLADFQLPIRPEEFNLFELRFRGKLVRAYVNGEFITMCERWPVQHQGYLGLLVAYADAQFRNMEIRQR